MSEVKENIVYHGSRNGNIDFLKAHVSTHGKECIYATENKTVACYLWVKVRETWILF